MPDPIPQAPPSPHLVFQREMPGRRPMLHLSFGNLLEIAGAGLGCYSIDLLVGVKWALVAGAVCLLVAAELIYDVSVVHVPLPRRARPIVWYRKTKRSRAMKRLAMPTRIVRVRKAVTGKLHRS